LDTSEGLWAQSKIAERRKDYGKAEEQLRRAVTQAPMKVSRLVDLAKFLAKRGRIDESEQTFKAAERIAPDNPRLLYHRAETYVEGHRNLDTARDLLKRYLSAILGPEDPPRSDAQKLLKQAGG
jgi:cytochrome c-type biogenesis protein CcmH/NrfG